MAVMPVRIGPYAVLSRLGVGGMAETYLALRRGPGDFEQHVCLKRIRREHESDPEFVRQFRREAAIAARLRHATIAQVVDFGSDGDDYYLALELVDGLDLRALLDAAPGGLHAELVQYVAIELATALDFAHRGGGDGAELVVHRDVSPSNALISGEGEVKLTDFGIARSLAGPQHTRTGIVKGKVPYLAPEYARSGRFDARCDLFSLGVVLYESACGARPHDGATDLETLERAGRGERIALAARAPALPAALCMAIEQLLEPDPELRYQSAAALLEALLALPAQSRARRELGALVTRVRKAPLRTVPEQPPPAPEATLPQAEPAQSNADALEPTRTLARAGAHTTHTESAPIRVPARRSGPLIALGIALVFGSAVVAFALLRPAARAPLAGAVPPLAAESAPAPTPVPAIAEAEPSFVLRPSAPSPTPAPTAAPHTQSATLDVVMLPYGEIFIDGRRIGRAPITLALPPGDHAIAGKSREGAELHRQVALTDGEHRRIVLR
jgi:serine/threonine protein kinase